MPTDFSTLMNAAPAGAITPGQFRDNVRLLVASDHAPDVLFGLLKSLKNLGFDMLVDVGGIDYLNYENATDRYAVVYALLNTESGERVFVKAFANDPDPSLPSAAELWRSADWMEREVYDLFGIDFPGHPDLRRILMPDGFEGHPLRKDYPLRGYGERHNFPTITRAEG